MVTSVQPITASASAAQELLEAGRATFAIGDKQDRTFAELYRAAGRFFAQPECIRRSAMLPSRCGYAPFGEEHSGNPDRPDQVDFFIYSPRVRHLVDGVASLLARDLLNAMIPVFDDLELVTERIAALIAPKVASLESPDLLKGGFRRWSLLEVHQARPINQGELINEAHEDGHFLTFAHANAPGLEIEVDGVFSPVRRPVSSMVVMPGSALTLLTGGSILPLRHRVRAGFPNHPRLSLLFFADLDPRRCIPWRTTLLNTGVDIGTHVERNSLRFGVPGFEPE